MKRHFENLANKAGRTVQHWWLMILAGILCVAMGIAVFIFPVESYVTISILTGVLMLVVGAAQLVTASTSGNYLTMRGYMVTGAVLDILLGVFLCVYPPVTMAFLPIMMGVWMMYHAFMTISFGGDLATFRVGGSMWPVAGGILLLILSIAVLFNPFGLGVGLVVLLGGVGLMLLGILVCWLAVILRNIDKSMEREYSA